MKICYVAHRYAPYPGGTEYFVQQMAEETLRRNHEVHVFSGIHKNDLNGVKVSSVFIDDYDLVVVHGADVSNQNMIHNVSDQITSKVLYQIIKPSESELSIKGLLNHPFLGWSTQEDLDHIKKYGLLRKAINVRHGLNPQHTIQTTKYFREKYNIKTSRMFVSAGGFYPHKAMIELYEVFKLCDFRDTTLVLLGYENGAIPFVQPNDNVKVLIGLEHNDVLNAIASADLYIMNSYEEGFGLVLIEAMMNKTPWAARNIAGAKMMSDYGYTYEDKNELAATIIKRFYSDDDLTNKAYDYVMNNHTIKHTVDDIEAVLWM